MFEPSKPNGFGSPKLYKTPQRGIKKDTQELECATENKENLYCENVLREKQQTPSKEVERLKNQLSQALAKAVAKNKKLTLSIQAEVENTRVANARIATLEEETTLLKSAQLAQERQKLEELEKKDNELKKLASENHELKLQVNDLQSQLLAAFETPVQPELPANVDCENCQLLATRAQVLSTEFERATIGHSVQKAMAKALAKSNEALKKENEELSASVAQIQQMGDHLQIVVETVSSKLANEHSLNQKLELQIKEFAQREEQTTEEIDQLTLQLDEHNQLCESMNEQLAQQQEQVNDLEYQLAAHEAQSRDAHVLCGLYDAVIADAKKEAAQAKEIVSLQNEKLAKHVQQQRDNRVLRGLFESIVETQRHHLAEARKKVQLLSREVGVRRRELESEREARARGVLEHETKLLASYEATKQLYERQMCDQRADFQECLDGLAEEKTRGEAEHAMQIGLFEMVVESLKHQMADREEAARMEQLIEVTAPSEIEIATLPEVTNQPIENASEEIAPAEIPMPSEPAGESSVAPIAEAREKNEDLRIQIALFEAVIESLRSQLESYEEQEMQRELQKIPSQQQQREKLVSPDKSANDSVLFKLHESARASEEQTAELLRLVRLLEEAATCERLAREEIEKKLALTVSEKEALLEQAVAITLEKEQLLALSQEISNNSCSNSTNTVERVESEVEFAAKLELERALAQERIDALNGEWQQKMQESSEQFAQQSRQWEQQSSMQREEARREQSERLVALAREGEQAKEEHARAEVAKAFVCFEGKQRQFDCKVTELEQEIEVRKVINLSLHREMEELKVLNVHLELELEKLESLKSELSSRESSVAELKAQLELEQACLVSTRVEMAKVEAAMVEMERKHSDLESSEQNLRAEAKKLELARGEMEQREQLRASELKCEMEKLQSMRSEMERRQSQIDDLKWQLEAMKVEMERRQRLLAELKSQLEASHAKADETRRECEARRVALAEREEELERRQREFDERVAMEMEAAQESQQRLGSQVEELQALLERKTQQCAQLETENESMQLALVELQSSGQADGGEVATQKDAEQLLQSLEVVRRELEAAQSELERKTAECLLLEKDLAKSAQNVNIDKELRELKELLRDARAEVAVERDERRREVDEKVAERMAEAAQTRERETQQERLSQSQIALAEKEQCIQQLRIDLSQLQSQLDAERSKVAVCLANELELQAHVAELQTNRDTLLLQQQATLQNANESSERAREAEEKIAQLEATRVESERRIDELLANIVYLEQQKATEAETKDANAQELSLARDELARLEHKLAVCTQEYEALSAEKAVAEESLARALEACAQHVTEREQLQARLEAAQGVEVRERDTTLLKDATSTIERLKKELHDAFAKVSVAQEDVKAAHEKAEHYRALNEEGERQLLEMVKLSAMQPVPTAIDHGKLSALVEEARDEEQARHVSMRDALAAQHRAALSALEQQLEALTVERDEMRRAVDELSEAKSKLEQEMEEMKRQQSEKSDAQEKAEPQEQEEKEKEEQEDVRKTIAFMRHNLSINTRELERLKGLIKGRDDVIMQLRNQVNELEEFDMVNQQLKEQIQQREKEFNVINVKNKKLQLALQQSQGETNRSQKELSEASTWQQQAEEAHVQIRIMHERHAAQEREIERLLEVEASQEAGNDQTRKENFLKMKKEINALKGEVSRLQESQYTQARGKPATQSTRTTGTGAPTLSSAYASSKAATNTNGTAKTTTTTTTSTLRSNIPKK